jgi:hypothetical protein
MGGNVGNSCFTISHDLSEAGNHWLSEGMDARGTICARHKNIMETNRQKKMYLHNQSNGQSIVCLLEIFVCVQRLAAQENPL